MPKKESPKTATSYRLSPEALRIIRQQAEKWGLSQAAVIEMAVRKQRDEC